MAIASNSQFQVLVDYLNLTKPAIASLNVFVGMATLLLVPHLNGAAAIPLLFLAVSGFLAAAGAGALNSFIERDIDLSMNRTRHRPLPSHRVSVVGAGVLGVASSLAGILIAAIFLNALTAVLIGLGVFWYALI